MSVGIVKAATVPRTTQASITEGSRRLLDQVVGSRTHPDLDSPSQEPFQVQPTAEQDMAEVEIGRPGTLPQLVSELHHNSRPFH